VLKNKGIISETLNPLKEAYEIMPAELRKGVNFELGLTYQAAPDWNSAFLNKAELDKATNKALKNLEKDPLFYTKLIATGEKPKKEEAASDIEFKESNVSDTTNKTKADGYLKKELKKDEDANVQASLSKSEAKKGKPEGVQQLKEGYMGTPYDSSEDMAVDMVKKGIKEDFNKVQQMLDKVADEWGKDSDLYSDLEDAIVGWSDVHGDLSPKGKIAIRHLLSNWDVLDDYEQFLNDDDADLHPGNMGDEMSAPTSMEEDAVQEATVPENIKKFAKSRGILPLVNQVARWAEKAGKGIRGGTAIGKNYSTLILDLSYQDGAIRIDTDNDTITVYDEPVESYQDFIAAVNQNSPQAGGLSEEKRKMVKEIIKKHVEEALKYSIGSAGEDREYRKTTDPELEKKLKDAGISFIKKNIS
jgi:hypothetical protein